MRDDNINNDNNAQEELYVSDLISDAIMPGKSGSENTPEVKAPSSVEVVAYQVAHPVKEIGKAQIIAGIVAIVAAIIAVVELIAEW